MFCRSTQTDVGEFDMDVYTVAFAQGLRRLASRCFGRERERRVCVCVGGEECVCMSVYHLMS
jgi:hypothetical protein